MAVKSLIARSAIPRTLRGRLITGLVSLLAIACASVGIVTYLAVQGALSRELNNDLQTATGLAYNCWETQGDGTPDSNGARQTGAEGTAAGTHAGTGLAVAARAGTGQDLGGIRGIGRAATLERTSAFRIAVPRGHRDVLLEQPMSHCRAHQADPDDADAHRLGSGLVGELCRPQ